MLFRKMLRDMKDSSVQFVSIFLMIFMGVMIYTGLNAVGHGMDSSSNRFYKDTNLADAYLYGEEFTKEEIKLLEQKQGVKRAERRSQIYAALVSDTKKTLQLNIVESNQISSNYLIEGDEFHPEEDGIWLNSAYAGANLLRVGDTIDLLVQGREITKKINGLIMNPEYVYALKDDNEVVPDHQNYGYAYLTQKALGYEVQYQQILLDTKLSKGQLEKIKEEVFIDKHTILVMQEDQPSVRMFHNEVQQTKAMQAVFPVAFLLIAVLTTLTTMSRITVNQRTQMGSLKALGFTDGRIIRHYMSYGGIIGTAGAVLGLLFGPVFLPNLVFDFQKGFYTLPEWRGEMEPEAFIIVLLCIIGCGLSGYLASRKELKGVAAHVLRPKPPKPVKHTRLEKSKWWNDMKFDFQWNIRDILRNKLRSIITITGIIGCMMLIVCAFGLRDTIDGITQSAYMEINTYQTKVAISETLSDTQLLELRNNNSLQFIQEAPIEIEMNNEIKSVMLTVVGKGQFLNFKDLENKPSVLPIKGISVTNKTAGLYGLKIGDKLKFKLYGSKEYMEGEVKTIIRNPVSQGVYISEDAYSDIGLTIKPTGFLSELPAENFLSKEFNLVQSKEDILNTMETMMETMNAIIAILVTAASILCAVVLYNLGVLSFHERMRELTTLKVLGFQYDILRRLLQKQNIWLTVCGIVIGVPSGYLLLSYMLKFMGDNFDLVPKVSIISYGLSVFGTLVLSMLVNRLLCRKLKTIDMVSALKAVE